MASKLVRTVTVAAFVAAAVLSAGALSQAHANLIEDGDFSTPNQSGGWTIYYPGINGWVNTNGDGIEIGYSPIYGLPCANSACQQLEVNANTFDTDQQTVNGLIVGHTYDLSWLYGGRTSGGPDLLNVSFGGTFLVQDSGSIGVWTPNSFLVTATATSETLVFQSVVTDGLPSYGNEITNVSLTATPLPAALPLFAGGLGVMGLIGGRRKKSKEQPALAAA
jgi:hypothetical protein